MALPVLDGNQSATTLSSVVTGGEHIVAHSVVCFGSTAIANITNAVSGSVVTIPSLAKIANSAATNGIADTTLNFIKIGGHQDGQNQVAHIVHVSAGGAMKVDASDSSITFGVIQGTVTVGNSITISNFPATQAVTFTQASVTFGTPVVTGSVSVLNFPSTQTIAGTVTANLAQGLIDETGDVGSQAPRLVVGVYDVDGIQLGANRPFPISGTVTANSILVLEQPVYEHTGTGADRCILIGTANADGGQVLHTSPDNPMPISGSISGTVTVGNSVTIGSLPAISGTVTANPSAYNLLTTTVTTLSFSSGGDSPVFSITPDLNGTWGFYADFDGSTNCVYKLQQTLSNGGSPQDVTVYSSANFEQPVTSFTSYQTLFVKYGSLPKSETNVWPMPVYFTFTKVSGITGSTISATIFKVNIPNHGFSSLVSGTVTVGNSVTISALPSGALTTRFGSVATANLAFITSAVTNTSRKYLLAQNISAGTVTIGIGFSPTTTQGIQLTAGGGLTFDAFCPTGAVYWLGAVTGANYCLIEG